MNFQKFEINKYVLKKGDFRRIGKKNKNYKKHSLTVLNFLIKKFWLEMGVEGPSNDFVGWNWKTFFKV